MEVLLEIYHHNPFHNGVTQCYDVVHIPTSHNRCFLCILKTDVLNEDIWNKEFVAYLIASFVNI